MNKKEEMRLLTETCYAVPGLVEGEILDEMTAKKAKELQKNKDEEDEE